MKKLLLGKFFIVGLVGGWKSRGFFLIWKLSLDVNFVFCEIDDISCFYEGK